MAGTETVARHFPFCVGRSPAADWRVEDSGVWDQHLTLSLRPDKTIEMTPQPGALVSVNGNVVSTALLRNGDVIGMGAAQIYFALSPTRQKGLGLRESLVWAGLVVVALLEVGLIYWLIDAQ